MSSPSSRTRQTRGFFDRRFFDARFFDIFRESHASHPAPRFRFERTSGAPRFSYADRQEDEVENVG